MINTTKNVNEATLITHGGKFHADDVMSTVILEMAFENVIVCRVLEVPKKVKKGTIIYDVGGGRWDHHQRGGNGARKNGIPYAASGLIWRDFGDGVIKCYAPKLKNVNEIWDAVDKMLIQGIDATDNGVANNYNSQGVSVMSICQLIANYNPLWNEKGDYDKAFLNACDMAREILANVIKKAISTYMAKEIVQKSIDNASNHIMILKKFVPWERYLYLSTNPKSIDIWFVVYPSLRGGFNWQTVPMYLKSQKPMKQVPKEWWGLKGKELQKITGIKTAIFCHDGGFIGGAETQEDTIKMAQKAVTS